MLNSLIDREYGKIARAPQTAMIEKRLQTSEYRSRTIVLQTYSIDKIRAGEMQLIPGDGFALVLEQILGLVSQQTLNPGKGVRSIGCGGIRHNSISQYSDRLLQKRAATLPPRIPAAIID